MKHLFIEEEVLVKAHRAKRFETKHVHRPHGVGSWRHKRIRIAGNEFPRCWEARYYFRPKYKR